MNGFAERLAQRAARLQTDLCLGLDPRPTAVPSELLIGRDFQNPEDLAAAYRDFCVAAAEEAAPYALAAKPQIAFFEALGAPGFSAFIEVCDALRGLDLPIIADVKRGDIGTTAEAYADAFLCPRGSLAPMADAITVNPYLGSDGVMPFLKAAREHHGGIFVLLRTSNRSSNELQTLETKEGSVVDVLSRLIQSWNKPIGPSGYGPIGVVVGATHPLELAKARSALPNSWILIPGYGAQGATAKDVVSAFDSSGAGALVNVSRALCTPWFLENEPAPSNWRASIRSAASRIRDEIRDAKDGR